VRTFNTTNRVQNLTRGYPLAHCEPVTMVTPPAGGQPQTQDLGSEVEDSQNLSGHTERKEKYKSCRNSLPSVGGGRLVLPQCFSVIFVWSGGYQYSLLVGGPRLLSFLLLTAIEFLCLGLVPRMRKLSLLLSPCGLREELSRDDGQVNQWPWQSLERILQLSGSLLVGSCKQRSPKRPSSA
jgi:hypothetical protein